MWTGGRRKQCAYFLIATTVAVTSPWWAAALPCLWPDVLTLGLALLALWQLVLLILCTFPDENTAHNNLMHSTPAWDAIKVDDLLLPTADDRIYLVDDDLVLGQRDNSRKNTTIVFVGAKTQTMAKRASYSAFHYLRFKEGRGEWLAPPYQRIRILEKSLVEANHLVTATAFQMEPLPNAARYMLACRRWAAAALLFVPFMCGGLAYTIVEYNAYSLHRTPHRYGLIATVIYIAVLICAFLLQNVYNAYYFRLARK